MLTRVAIAVRDVAASKSFYEATLAPLGYVVKYQSDGSGASVAFGKTSAAWQQYVELILTASANESINAAAIEIAFFAESEEQVVEVFKAALDVGGKQDSPPGYGFDSDYYGMSVRDPDGNRIEVFCYLMTGM